MLGPRSASHQLITAADSRDSMKTEKRVRAGDSHPAHEGSLPGTPSVSDYALLEELRFVRREAQAEANIAYRDWTTRPLLERYAVYRAAQDRADAAQDQLAAWARALGRELAGTHAALATR
jgi:acyl-CoA reductase-like NAD-dependent aldehyde dehydrogenase